MRVPTLTLIISAAVCLAGGVGCFAQPAVPAPAPAGTMKVGIATTNITPAGPVWMRGWAARDKEPSKGVHADLTASCLVFDNGRTRVGLMALDLCAIAKQQLGEIRQAAEKVGIPPQQMMINCSHTHCGPHMSSGRNAKYFAFFKERIYELLQAAAADLQEATLDYTVGTCTMAINRRQSGLNGKASGMRPDPRKPIDPAVPVLRVLSRTGAVRAVVFGYACHTTAMGGQEISPDYAGPAREWIAAAIPGCVPVFLQGFGGDIKPRAVTAKGAFGYVLLDGKQTMAELGHELGRAVIAAICVPPKPLSGTQLGGISELVPLPDKKDPAKSHTIEVEALRIGDLYIFGSQCEVCVEIGLRIKRELAGVQVWANGYTHWGTGYIPAASSYAQNYYEVKSTAVAPASEDILVGKAIELIRRLQAGQTD